MNAPITTIQWVRDGLDGLWLGTSIENQQAADERIPLLLQTPLTVRFLSCEPLLGPVDLSLYLDGEYASADYGGGMAEQTGPSIDWVIVGGESGPNARPLHPDWVRSLREQCVEVGIPFLFKQWGEWFPRDQWEHNPNLILPDDDAAYRETSRTHLFEDMNGSFPVHRVGKKAAGRVLDGYTWDEMPAVTR